MSTLAGFVTGPVPEPMTEAPPVAADHEAWPVVAVTELESGSGIQYKPWGGDKFHGGFGITELLDVDYWTLRVRSGQLFRTNLYARGLLRRLVDNVIVTGLHLESVPVERVLGLEEDSLSDWSDNLEARFDLWAGRKDLCDFHRLRTFGQLQAAAWREALIDGDVLVILQDHPDVGLPSVRLVSGSLVQTPLGASATPNPDILHGVELDVSGRQVAYHIAQADGTFQRIPAFGESGRRLAWLVYGTDRRLDDVRGEPLLSLMLQSLREIDRYRDSAQRKADMASRLALYVTKSQPTLSTQPFTGGAVRRGTGTVGTALGTEPRQFRTADLLPGMVIEQLAEGEEPKAFPSVGTDERFGEFERAIVSAIAWANGCPPENLTLSFSSNYSASQAAINEFKLYLSLERTNLGASLCQPIFEDWFLASVLKGDLDAPGFLDAYRDSDMWAEASAWVKADWAGQMKPSTDVAKHAKGLQMAIDLGLITRGRAARELSGMKFSRVVQQLTRENEALAVAKAPLAPEPETPDTESSDDD